MKEVNDNGSENKLPNEFKRRQFLSASAAALPGIAFFPENTAAKKDNKNQDTRKTGELPIIGKVAFRPSDYEANARAESISLEREKGFYSGINSLKLDGGTEATVNSNGKPLKKDDELQYYVKPLDDSGVFILSIDGVRIDIDIGSNSLVVKQDKSKSSINTDSELTKENWYRVFVNRSKKEKCHIFFYDKSNKLLAKTEHKHDASTAQSTTLSTRGGRWIMSPITGPSISKKYNKITKKEGRRKYPEMTFNEQDSTIVVKVSEKFNSGKKFKTKTKIDKEDGTCTIDAPWGKYIGRFPQGGD